MEGGKRYGLIDAKELKVSLQFSKVKEKQPATIDNKLKENNENDKRSIMEDYNYPQSKYDAKKKSNLLEDSSVYQYDELYDDMKAKNEKVQLEKALEKKSHKPKYMTKILKHAQFRQIENDRRAESKIQREREMEGDEFQDKETYITDTYKEKMEQSLLRLEMDKKAEELENKDRENLTFNKFYNNIYKLKFGQVLNPKVSDDSDLDESNQTKASNDGKQSPKLERNDDLETELSSIKARDISHDRKRNHRSPKHRNEDDSNSKSAKHVKPHISAPHKDSSGGAERTKKSVDKTKRRKVGSEDRVVKHEKHRKHSRDKSDERRSHKSSSKYSTQTTREESRKEKHPSLARHARRDESKLSDNARKSDKSGHQKLSTHKKLNSRKKIQKNLGYQSDLSESSADISSSESEREERERQKVIVNERLKIFARRNTDSNQISQKLGEYIKRLQAAESKGGLDPGFESSSLSTTIGYDVILRLFAIEN
ncbi:unnamed protein product [Gordionus sp. m RMFG-2023]|uniref:nuclear speckle splicing regulatory protein 1-like n=1 Tax=Gordionus sp. m RMFG-2023 TaxID=3053472 RepID=UPI0030E3D9DA